MNIAPALPHKTALFVQSPAPAPRAACAPNDQPLPLRRAPAAYLLTRYVPDIAPTPVTLKELDA
jgi:hypothetical protein